MLISDLAPVVNSHASEICAEFWPRGRASGGYYQIGSMDGEKGQSLRAYLKGDRAGHWTDNATGEHGDMLDVIQYHLGADVTAAMDWAVKRFGLTSGSARKIRAEKPKAPLAPLCLPERIDASPSLHQYLEGRGFDDPARICLDWQLYEADGNRLVFPFLNASGERVPGGFLKLKAMVAGGKSKPPTGGTAERYRFYGWHMVPPDARQIMLVEGELDAISAHELGVPALSLPQGAGAGSVNNTLENEIDALDRFETIFVATDQDAAGDEAFELLKARLAQRVLRVRIPRKDLTEVLELDGLDAGRRILSDAINAAWIDPETILQPVDLADSVIESFNESSDTGGFDLGFSHFDIDLKFRPSEVWIFGGENGSGKSMLLGQICLNAIAQDRRVMIASFEMLPVQTLHRMVRQITGLSNPSSAYARAAIEWLSPNCKIWHSSGGIMAGIDSLLEDCEYVYRRYGVSVFVIDSISLLANVQENEAKLVFQIITKICDFKRRLPVTVFLVSHLRKTDPNQPPGKADIKGSGAITDLADGVLILNKNKRKASALSAQKMFGDPVDEDLADQFDVTLACEKYRNGGFDGAVGFNFDSDSFQYTNRSGRKRTYFDWSAA